MSGHCLPPPPPVPQSPVACATIRPRRVGRGRLWRLSDGWFCCAARFGCEAGGVSHSLRGRGSASCDPCGAPFGRATRRLRRGRISRSPTTEKKDSAPARLLRLCFAKRPKGRSIFAPPFGALCEKCPRFVPIRSLPQKVRRGGVWGRRSRFTTALLSSIRAQEQVREKSQLGG